MGVTVTETNLPGLLVLETTVHRDDRGFLTQSYRRDEFAGAGIAVEFVQENRTRSKRHVLRGLHYQAGLAPMAKLVRCASGVILDVAVDLREGSPEYGKHFAIVLNSDEFNQVFIPVGFAHGFLVLSDWAELIYKCSALYDPRAEGGVAWNDPDLAVEWPATAPIVSERDSAAASFAQYRRSPAFVYGTT